MDCDIRNVSNSFNVFYTFPSSVLPAVAVGLYGASFPRICYNLICMWLLFISSSEFTIKGIYSLSISTPTFRHIEQMYYAEFRFKSIT